MRSLINHNQVKEPVCIPCGACVALYENQSPQRPQSNHRFWSWFDRVTRYSLIPKIIVVLTPMTFLLVLAGFMTNITQRLLGYHAGTIQVILMILLFCEGMFLLGLLVDVPYDYNCNVVTNPAFEDLEENAWHEREINQP
jgi:hypothetical protein